MSQAKQDFLSSTTSDKSHYIRMWEAHVRELETMGIPLINASVNSEYYDELQEIQQRLNQLIKIAADEDFDND